MGFDVWLRTERLAAVDATRLASARLQAAILLKANGKKK